MYRKDYPEINSRPSILLRLIKIEETITKLADDINRIKTMLNNISMDKTSRNSHYVSIQTERRGRNYIPLISSSLNLAPSYRGVSHHYTNKNEIIVKKITDLDNSIKNIEAWIKNIDDEFKKINKMYNDMNIVLNRILSYLEKHTYSMSKDMSMDEIKKIIRGTINKLIHTIRSFINLYELLVELTRERKINGAIYNSDLTLIYDLIFKCYNKVLEYSRKGASITDISELRATILLIQKLIDKVNYDVNSGDILRMHLPMIDQGFIDPPTDEINIDELKKIIDNLKHIIKEGFQT